MESNSEGLIPGRALDEAVAVLRLLSNRERLKVLCVLIHEGERNVGELQQAVGMSQSALSQHLALLRSAGVVSTRREAQSIYYSIQRSDVGRIIRLLRDLYCPDGGGGGSHS